MKFAIVATASLVLAFYIIVSHSPPEPSRSIYDVNWEDVSWCVYSRLDFGYQPPEALEHIIRFCVVIGDRSGSGA